MQSLFAQASELKVEQLREKALQMVALREKMSQILEKQIEYTQDGDLDDEHRSEELEKAKTTIVDCRNLLN